ncbi:TAR DNA-binding protein 43-like [Sitodiplosis mosellana]|uniref:TAR DNA-binding protein 43-like n=1 Tax=Sitodiplosis mosellana TaxID=263140 RepID=UPI002444CE3E|nr:TAR DNA-binding protein 43-like [Sitodiplosis mosellana]
MSIEYVQVAEEEGEETIELPIEKDGTLLLSTLQGQFPGTSCLKYRNSVSNAIRGIRLTEGRLYPPSEDGWGNQVYLCAFPKNKNRELPSLPPTAPPVTASSETWCGRIIGFFIPNSRFHQKKD